MENEQLATWLATNKLGQAEFARLIGVSPVTVWRWALPKTAKAARPLDSVARAFMAAYSLMTCEQRAMLALSARPHSGLAAK